MGHYAGMNDSPHGLGLARWPPQQFGMPGNTHMNQTNALDAGNMKALVVRQVQHSLALHIAPHPSLQRFFLVSHQNLVALPSTIVPLRVQTTKHKTTAS